MNMERIENIVELLRAEKHEAAERRDLVLVRQLGTILQILGSLVKRENTRDVKTSDQ